MTEPTGFARIRDPRHKFRPGVPARQGLLKRQNLALVLGRIAGSPGATRAQVAAGTGLTKATVSTLVDALVESGLLVEHDPERGPVGRPGNPLTLNPEGPAGLGIEINVDYVSSCVVDMTGAVRAQRSQVGDNRRSRPARVLESAATLADELLARPEVAGLPIAGMTVAVPGLVDFDGVLHRAPNLLDWQGVSVGESLQARLARPTGRLHCDNEANLAALGEYWFGHGHLNDFVYVSGEIGVGAGIVMGGELFRGVSGLGGELGHVTVDPNGPLCSCGAFGCLESLAGKEALLKAAAVEPRPRRRGGAGGDALAELVEGALGNEERKLCALERAGTALGVALSAFLNVLDLPAVVLGGFYADLSPWLLGPINRELRHRVVNYSWSSTEVMVSTLPGDASVRGAAGIATRRIIDDPATFFPDLLSRG